MAKLSARGRTELVRVSRELTIPAEQDSLIDWSRTTVVVMSDRHVLSKRDVRFRSDSRKHSYGWKNEGKLKDGMEANDFIARHYTTEKGWVKES